MGADGHTTIWNHDKIHAEATRRGGIVAKQFAQAHFGYNVYQNPFGADPAQLGVCYRDNNHHYTPLALFQNRSLDLSGELTPWPTSTYEMRPFELFCKEYEAFFAGSSMGFHLTDEDLMQFHNFITWAYENALIAVWEVWT